MISLAGLAGGLIIGLGFAFLQQQFGIIRMPGHFIVQAYPVVISWIDVLLVTGGVAIIGYLIALLPVSILSRR
jgi:ABC-type antimicrobial peptide transport system permease subunit